MSRRLAVITAALVVLMVSTGCESSSGPGPGLPRPTSTKPTPADVSEYESGPESPIAYGLQVPTGATQLGPLLRYRSPDLIAAYQPELDAAEAQRAAEQQRRRAEAEADGTPLPPPTPTPTARPSDDTFKLIDDPPKPDTTVSLMRIDGSPTTVMRRMIAQINAVLPTALLVTDDISQYCESRDNRVTSCSLTAEGTAVNERELSISLTIDPGDVDSRTSPPSAKRRPVMTLTAAYVGDPRRGQVDREDDGNIDVPQDVKGEDRSGLIWPKMDVDAPPSAKLLDGWRAPRGSTILLSGYDPAFVAVAADRATEADRIASDYADSVAEPTKDVVEDLNEITTTYTSVADNGARAVASYVLSARGNFAILFYTPPPE